MTPRLTNTDPKTDGNPPVETRPPEGGPATPAVNPNLSANLVADYEALQNDMEQAKELAADFQRQLAGKSNEFAQLKQLFEKTLADLSSLQTGIVELRSERHRLANEAMRASAFQMKLEKVTGERDRLRVDLEFVRKALAHSGEEMAAALRERDTQIASLVIELVTLKEALAEARRNNARGSASARHDPVGEKPPDFLLRTDARNAPADEVMDISFGS